MKVRIGDNSQPRGFERGSICRGGQQHILYGWALDAPALKLPEGVGFKVGGHGGSNIHFLVLQVHYHTHNNHLQQQHDLQKLPSITDNSGLVLDVKLDDGTSGITKQAGVLVLLSTGLVQPGKSRHEIWCEINDDIEIHPFRFRVHTHKLGTEVFGAKLGPNSNQFRRNVGLGNGADDLIIGVGDPQKPQMFYPIRETDMTVRRGDTVYAYCEFNNNRSRVVRIGATAEDEMCNFYLMYWTESPKLLKKDMCFGANPPRSSIFSSIW